MPEGERAGGQHVLAEDGGAPEAELELAGVDRGRHPVAERAEHVAPQPDGGGDEDEQAGAALEGGGEGSQHRSRHQAGGGVQCERDEPLPGVSARQQAAAGHGGRPRVARVVRGTAGRLPSTGLAT